MKITPSILSADFTMLEQQITEAYNNGLDFFHLDVMDGIFVPNISFGQPVIRSILKKKKKDMIFDAHLMIDSPGRFIEEFCEMGCDYVTIHPEAEIHIERTLSEIRKKGSKSGIALNPGTSLEVLDYLMDSVDLILIMSVNPGFGGQSFIPCMERKILEVRKKIDQSGKNILLQVDGGVNSSNIKKIKELGVDLAVCGSAVFNTQGIEKSILELKKSLI